MSVKNFPLTPIRATELIRQCAADGDYLLPLRFAEGDWPHVVYRRQAIRCLESGKIIGGPTINEHGHYEYRMHRLSAGQDIYLKVVLYKSPDWVVRVLEAAPHE